MLIAALRPFKPVVLQPIQNLGVFSIFLWNATLGLKQIHRRIYILLHQIDFIGVQSLTVVTFSSIFLGSVMAFQTYVALHYFGMDSFLGSSVGIAFARELAPVFTGIMVAGRAGAAIAAEIASMRVTEQIDAMDALGTDPHDYLVSPRIVAGTLSMPILSAYFHMIGCTAGYFVATVVCNTDGAAYWNQLAWAVDAGDLWQGLIKATLFGFSLTSIGCYYGYHAGNSAESVGVAANKAVVTTCLFILFSDYILTAFLPYDPSNLILK